MHGYNRLYPVDLALKSRSELVPSVWLINKDQYSSLSKIFPMNQPMYYNNVYYCRFTIIISTNVIIRDIQKKAISLIKWC